MPPIDRELEDVNVFVSPELQPDVRLKVFGTWEFHVHSVILKLYSAFFRKFLDPANKQGETTPGTNFKYEWVTEIDDDGKGWHLISESSLTKELKMEDYSPHGSGDALSSYWVQPIQQARLLHKLLGALYLQPYSLSGPEELIHMVDLADYYCMLRILSRTLDGALDATEEVAKLLRHDRTPCRLLPAAAKLRHKRLFSDCIILSIGPWHKPNVSYIEEPKLQAIAQAVRDRISIKISHVLENIIALSTASTTSRKRDAISNDMLSCATENRIEGHEEQLCLPLYIKAVSGLPYQAHQRYVFQDACSEVMVNRLNLYPHVVYALYVLEDRFLCDTVREEELPWDVRETDW